MASEIANRYISDPGEALKLGQKVQVKVMEVDVNRKRIALSIKQASGEERVQGDKKARRQESFKRQEEDLSALSVNDALSALKKKFGK